MLTERRFLPYAVDPGTGQITLTGPNTMRGGEAIRREQESRDLWPYPWIMAPKNSECRLPPAFIDSPALGTPTVILTFSVPSGYVFEMTDLLLGAFTTGQIAAGNPGDFILSVDRNTPIGGGVLQGSPIADWNNIPFNQGSIEHGPLHLPRSRTFAPETVLRAKVTNNSLGVGPPFQFCAQFGGWLLPDTGRS
jgi:hypothetical protein